MKFREMGSSLESRARKNGRSIDGEWIVENETREYDLNKGIANDNIDYEKDIEDILRNINLLDDLPDEKTSEQVDEINNTSQFDDETQKRIDDLKNNLGRIFRG